MIRPRMLLLVLALLMLLSLPALAEGAALSIPDQEGFSINADGSLQIALWENGSTGFEWEYEIDDEDILRFGSEMLSADPAEDTSEEAPVVGAPNMHVWRFEPLVDGEALISFYYQPAWEDSDVPDRMLCYTVTIEDGKVLDCEMEDLGESEYGDDEAVISYAGETGGVPLEIFEEMTETQTEEGTLLTSQDELTTILINYEPTDDPDELFEQLKDVDSAAAIYDDPETGVAVISCDVDLDDDIPYVTMVYYVADGIVDYTGYKAPDGGVLHVHMTYLLGDDEAEDWSESEDDESV